MRAVLPRSAMDRLTAVAVDTLTTNIADLLSALHRIEPAKDSG